MSLGKYLLKRSYRQIQILYIQNISHGSSPRDDVRLVFHQSESQQFEEVGFGANPEYILVRIFKKIILFTVIYVLYIYILKLTYVIYFRFEINRNFRGGGMKTILIEFFAGEV